MAKRIIYDIPMRNPEDDPYRELREAARAIVVNEAREKTMKFDPEHEAEIMRRLDALGEPYKSTFLQMRDESLQTRSYEDPLSQQEIDLLNLQAMERSAAFRRE